MNKCENCDNTKCYIIISRSKGICCACKERSINSACEECAYIIGLKKYE